MMTIILRYILRRSRILQTALLLATITLSAVSCKTCICNDKVAQYQSARYNPLLIFDSTGQLKHNTDAEQFGRSPWPRPIMGHSYVTPSEKLTYNEAIYLRQYTAGGRARDHYRRRVWGRHRRDTVR